MVTLHSDRSRMTLLVVYEERVRGPRGSCVAALTEKSRQLGMRLL